MKKYFLELIVFLSGAIVMVLELTASRVLAPVVGTSTFVWTAIIGLILSCLSLGYWWGGRLADKNPALRQLSRILFMASAYTALISFINPFILAIFYGLQWNVILGTIVLTLLLFAPQSILLGMVSPYAAKLSLQNLDQSGRTMGRLYALSTIGSIIGTFAAGFVLIPALGSQKIVGLCALLLFVLSVLAFPQNILRGITLFIFILASLFLQLNFLKTVADWDSTYNRIQIIESEDPQNGKNRVMMLLNGHPQSALYLPEKTNAFSYVDFLNIYKLFNPMAQKTLMLGGGGYIFPLHYLQDNPSASMDVVEIDPQVTLAAKKYFGLTADPRLRIFHQDARIFLNQNETRYDLIFGDVFNGKYVLHHMTTLEAITKISDSLTEEGVCVVNIIASIEGPMRDYLKTQVKTFQKVFPQVYLFSTRENYDGNSLSNLILVAMKSPTLPNLETSDPLLQKILRNQWKTPIQTTLPILTDAYAPVEYYCF